KTVETITQWNGIEILSKFTDLRTFRNNSYNQYIKSKQKKFKFFDDQISKREITSSKQLERYKIWKEQIEKSPIFHTPIPELKHEIIIKKINNLNEDEEKILFSNLKFMDNEKKDIKEIEEAVKEIRPKWAINRLTKNPQTKVQCVEENLLIKIMVAKK